MGMPRDIGIIDLGIGFPYGGVEEKVRTYDFFRANLKDAESVREMEFPAQYMFKQVPDIVDPSVDRVAWVLEKMDRFGIRVAKVGLSEHGIRAQREHPDRFVLSASVNPNEGALTLRKLEKQKADHDIVSASIFPSGLVPQAAVNDPKLYPVYMKCIDLGIPLCSVP